MKPLTQRQAEAMRFITTCIDSDGVAPTHAELMAALDLKSKGGPSRLIDELCARGYLKRDAGRARALKIRRRLPADMGGDAGAIAARLRRDAGRIEAGPERDGLLTAAKHYAAVSAGKAKPKRRR